jgi:hypothetical protein
LIGAEPNGVPLGTATQAAIRALNGPSPSANAEHALGNAGNRWEFVGQGDEQQDAFRQLGVGLGASILLMYLVLALLYESWLQPILILTALPLATVGAFLGLLVFHQTLSVPSFIGLIALFGLVGKNSILLVDRTNDLRRAGLDRISALEQAAPSRLRPILMTSAVLILAMLPVALRLGDGGEMRAPLGAVLVGGMATSTFLSLLYVPVVYTYFDTLQGLLGDVVHGRLPFTSHRAGRPSLRVLPPADQPRSAPDRTGRLPAHERAQALRQVGHAHEPHIHKHAPVRDRSLRMIEWSHASPPKRADWPDPSEDRPGEP